MAMTGSDPTASFERPTMKFNLRTRLTASFGALIALSTLIGIGSLQSVMTSFRCITGEVWPKSSIANGNIRGAYDYARAFAYVVTSDGRVGANP